MIVYNCANVKKMSLSAFIETGEHCRDQVHFKQCVWIPSTTVSQCRFMQYIRCILYQWLPAILIDTILYFKTGKPM